MATKDKEADAPRRNLDDMTPAELTSLSLAAEAKVNVLRGKAMREDRYSEALSKATNDASEIHAKMKEQGIDPASTDPTATVPDKEGTAPSLADAHGEYAEDAEVANLGGIGIDDSNTNPEEVRQELEDRAGPDAAEVTAEHQERRAAARAEREGRGSSTRRERLPGKRRSKSKAKADAE